MIIINLYIDKDYLKKEKLQLPQDINDNKIIEETLRLIKNKAPMQLLKEINISKGPQIQ